MRSSVLIVDDHAGFRSRARTLLTRAGYEVVGEAGDGESGVRAAAELAPQLVLLDVQLPDISGFEVARRLNRATGHAPDIVLVSSREASDYGRRVHECGARGFVTKDELTAAALDAVLEGPQP